MPNPSPAAATPRRKFLNWVLGTSAGGLLASVLYPVLRYLVPPVSGEAATGSVTLPFKPDEIPENTGKIFKFGNRPGLLVRTATNELHAFSATCTHLGCIVQYRPDLAHIWCACHNGHYDLNGRNIAGPPPAPLEEFTVNLRGDQIVIGKRS
jgi:cytochrome b6-f complex iron-sulfur subunit